MKTILAVLSGLFLLATAKETVEDAARIARNLVDHSPNAIGVIATTFPSNHSTLAGEPFALQEYYGGCFKNGSLALLMFPISQTGRNIYASDNKNKSATITVQSTSPAASLPRVALIGSVTTVEPGLFEEEGVEDCYVGIHKDSKYWVPSKWGTHNAFWARFDPHAIYFVGGFGGLHYIGYIPVDLYRSSGSKGSEEGFVIQRNGYSVA